MWILKAPVEQSLASGDLFGHQMADGYVLVSKQYWYQFFLNRNFIDVTPEDWRGASQLPLQRILMIQWGGVGDAIFPTVVAAYYKDKYPDCEILFAGVTSNTEILKNNEVINDFVTCPAHNIGNLVEQFDEAIDFSGAVTFNFEAEHRNAYEVYLKFAGIRELPKVIRPVVLVTPEEQENFRNRLDAIDGVPLGSKYFLVQVESSTELRNWPMYKFDEIIKRIRKEYPDYYVFVVGENARLSSMVFFTCKKCKMNIEYTLSKKVKDFWVTCSHCKEKILLTTRKNVKIKNQVVDIYHDPMVKYFMKTISLRELACMVADARCVLGVDSSCQHIAGAMGVPAVGIFSSFVGELRLKHFKNSSWIQKPFQCAPCFLHNTVCPLKMKTKAKYPLCMDSITVDEVFNVFKDTLDGNYHRPKDDFDLVSSRPCPYCGETVHTKWARKGDFIHQICSACNAIYTNKVSGNEEAEKFYSSPKYFIVYDGENKPLYEKSLAAKVNTVIGPPFDFSGSLLEIGSAYGHFLNSMKGFGWDVTGVEISKHASKSSKNTYKDICVYNKNIEDWSKEKDFFKGKKYDVVVMNNSLEHLIDLQGMVGILDFIMKQSSILVILGPDANQKSTLNNWGHINTFFAGEHAGIGTIKSLELLFKDWKLVEYKQIKYSAELLAVFTRGGIKV